MTYRQLLLFTLALALMAAAIGCRDSAKKGQPAPVGSPAPVADAQKSAAVPANPSAQLPVAVGKVPTNPVPPPDLSTLVPVKTFQIKPPAAFAADQLPQNDAVEFLFSGSAGQILRVRVDQPFRVQVQPQGAAPAALNAGGDSAGNWFYGLPKTGTYRVLYAPWQTTPGIQFDFLPINDPMADPGVKPEEVSVDFGELAHKEELVVAAYALNEDEDYWDSWPTHLAVAHRDFEFRIMTVAGNKKVFKKNERMTAVEAAVRAQSKHAEVKKLPYPVYRGGGLNLWTRSEFLEGDGWRGLRWIAGFGQDITCSQDLGYYFEGISNDGRFFVLLRAHLSSSALAWRFGKDCAAAEAEVRNPDLNAVFQKDMFGADPASFQPNLDQLDAVIRSLKLKH